MFGVYAKSFMIAARTDADEARRKPPQRLVDEDRVHLQAHPAG